jgi:hypothetical protein
MQSYDEIPTGQMQAAPLSSYGNTLYLEDLQSFHATLDMPLRGACQALQDTDYDLAQALGGICNQVAELVDSTAAVVQTHGLMAQQIFYEVLPNFRYAIAEGNGQKQASCVASARVMINKMKNDAKAVRGSYLNVLESVQYLGSCTQLAVDFYELSEDPSSLEDIAWAPDLLEQAMRELHHIHSVLADPSDFWLIFHVTELELGRIENATHQFSQITCAMTQARASSQIWEALQQLSWQYLVPHKHC